MNIVAALAPIGGVLAAAVWVRRNLVVVRVTGFSMEPTYRSGDRVLVRRCHVSAVRAGQVIVILAGKRLGGPPPIDDPFWVIKRVAAAPGDPVPRTRVPALGAVAEDVVPDDCLVVLGDNPAGTDSRQFGYFAGGNLLGAVVRPRAQRRQSARICCGHG
ncbi:S26 family signal peptidase [Cryptosporangium arvum]|uniref:Putative transcriptional regulator n=1 Tax=Cryptosporangium arvum DSM 44712 TaxID=927661 RepID=A0A010Z4V4_9ACTN|nr:S26 family signal peptidase [Cryptosporangium arvum]EXG82378.1 putative transcriptional regulator [Cryptosporangium arvum DSM 44712]